MIKEVKKQSEVRSPVVAVMGHIDHGKSTLLDYIRKSKVAENEAGGITQKMSAYEVEVINPDSKKLTKITFLDTPGHEAFKAIRARGAKVADIAILIVASDDGVKPQTLEALKCIKEEKMPFIVAINKIDKEGANVEKTRNALAENEIYLEGYGGDIPAIEISAKTGKNIQELLDLICLVADIEDLKGDSTLLAEGFVLESSIDTKKGITATLIIKNGLLKTGMFLSSGNAVAPIRVIENFLGEKINEAKFSSPIKIMGWNEIPQVGNSFKTFNSKKEAESYSKSLLNQQQPKAINSDNTIVNEELVTIPLIIKTDTEGSLEAIKHELNKLQNVKVKFNIVNSGIGLISENDVKNALLDNNPIILGFNTKLDSSAKNLAERESVLIKLFDVIYKITEWLKTDLANILPKIDVEEITGKIKVLKIFGEQKEKIIIGGKVNEGSINLGGTFKVIRKENIIGTGKVKELQQKKLTTSEVKEGNEFGALIETKVLVSAGDALEFYKVTKQPIKI